MKSKDLYLARAGGVLESQSGLRWIPNPDLDFEDMKRLMSQTEAAFEWGQDHVLKGFYAMLPLTPAMFFFLPLVSSNLTVTVGKHVIFTVMLSLLVTMFVCLFVLMGPSLVNAVKRTFDPSVKAARRKSSDYFTWQAPNPVVRSWELMNMSLKSLREKDLDTNTAVSLNDVELQYYLTLREVKAAKGPQQAKLAEEKAEALALQIAALSYAWDEKTEKEQEQLETVLTQDGVNVDELINYAIDATPELATPCEQENVLTQLEERHA